MWGSGSEGGGRGANALAPLMRVSQGGRVDPGAGCRRQRRGVSPSFCTCDRGNCAEASSSRDW